MMSDDNPLVQELRAQLQAMADEARELRVQIAQRDRWIRELRDTVAAFMGAPAFPLHIRAPASEKFVAALRSPARINALPTMGNRKDHP